jgi:hypothetical protein
MFTAPGLDGTSSILIVHLFMKDDAYAWCFELQIFLQGPVKPGDFWWVKIGPSGRLL